MTTKNNLERQIPQPEFDAEKEEKFKPQIIFDFIRHGQAEYGQKVKEKVKNLGYNFEDFMPTSKIAEEELDDKRKIWEGQITTKGNEQLKTAITDFVKKLNKDKETLMILFGPRFRQEQSSKIIFDELEKQGVNVLKARQHKNLIDLKKHWISVLEFVSQKTKDKPVEYWLSMNSKELEEADLEGLQEVGGRMEHFIELIKRYARRYQKELRLDEKILRVMSVTSDINILSLLEKQKESLKSVDINAIKNAQIVEMGVDKDGDTKFID
ncbi:hypothetical protein L6278_02320 [Candidatus Parcubacteria bacterium]|nr:hypothetical protein [Candidatus Parcubacteria bacterium]